MLHRLAALGDAVEYPIDRPAFSDAASCRVSMGATQQTVRDWATAR
jgi:hypothetical protein